MSQVYYTVTDDGKLYFTSSKNVWGASNIPVPGNRPKTKEECLRFLEYLRTKEDPVVPHRTVRVGLLNAQYVDSYIKKSERLKVIKESKSSEDAYADFARKFTETGYVDKNLRVSIPASLWYKEDFYEYLISQGIPAPEAAVFTKETSAGCYAKYSSEHKKEKTLAKYSETLHRFAHGAKFASRDTIFEQFDYEYRQFKRDEEKARISAIPDKEERNRQAVLKCVNSNAIRNHLDKTGYRFSSLEAAWLIYQSRGLTVNEKHDAWKGLIDYMPDCEIPERNHLTRFMPSLHSFLEEYIETEKSLIDGFMRPAGDSKFVAERIPKVESSDDAGEPEFIGIFSSFESFGKAYKELPEPNERTEGFSLRKVTADEGDKGVQVFFSPTLEITGLYAADSKSGRLRELADIFKGLWFDFPTPFKPGDIVFNPKRPLDIFVLEGINKTLCSPSWKQRTCKSYSPTDDSSEHFNNENMVYTGFGINMAYASEGAFRDDRFWLKCESNYMDLEFYNGPLEGYLKGLVPVSGYFKGNINRDECNKKYREIMESEYSKRLKGISDFLSVSYLT
ncbi:MAG: hypothetical protein J6X47_04915 [Clostridia bacterium]|nr:hypothetical protein [Clostridia bacterium]